MAVKKSKPRTGASALEPSRGHDATEAVAAFAKLSHAKKLAIMKAAGVKLKPLSKSARGQ